MRRRATRAFKLTAILVYCSVRDWTRFLRQRIRKYPHTVELPVNDHPKGGAEVVTYGSLDQ